MKNTIILMMTLILSVTWANASKVEGVLVFDIGDSFTAEIGSFENYYLQTEKQLIKLDASEAFKNRMPVRSWVGKKVSVNFKNEPAADFSRKIQSIQLLDDASKGGGIVGSQKWVSFLCKFSDIAAEPENEAFFDEMYANSPAGLDHYWREVSYNKANVAGSVAYDWVDLPLTRDEYVPEIEGELDADLNLLFDDCTAAAISANPSLDINDDFVGINMMFNDRLDCCAWGGGRWTALDGGNARLWRVTWNPPWAFANQGVIAHEMGHGFGLPHTNNSDEDSNPYDNRWDVMSSATGNAVNDNVYGRLGKHINMYHKERLGWVNEDDDGFMVSPDTFAFRQINWTSLTTSANEKYARIPLSDGSSYYIESRQESGQYESNLAGTAVIIHHVVSGRSEPAWVIDADDPPADTANTEGVMWKVGETFNDPIDGYQVEVIEQVNAGFKIRIVGPGFVDLIFADGFEQ